jgi:hypothetical protein
LLYDVILPWLTAHPRAGVFLAEAILSSPANEHTDWRTPSRSAASGLLKGVKYFFHHR